MNIISAYLIKADSYKLCLMQAAAAEECVQKIENFLSQLRQCNFSAAVRVNEPLMV